MYFTEKEVQFLENYVPIYGVIQCAQILNRNVHRIYEKCSRLKIHSKILEKLTSEQIESLREKFMKRQISLDFSNNPKQLAYFLGYFWADGYILSSRPELRLEITKEDGLNIQFILETIGDFNIFFRNRKNHKSQMMFQCTNKEVSLKLQALGKYSNSIESHKKIMEFIPKEYHIYFLRGLIDGDGCFYVTEKATQFSISNSYNFDWSYLIEYLKDNFNFNCTIVQRTNKSSSSAIRNTNQHEIYNFVSKIYEHTDGIWLNRKYDKILLIYSKENKKYAKNDQTI